MALSLDGTTGISASGNITGGNVIASGALIVGSFTPATVSTAGNVTGGNLVTGGLISAAGNITGAYIFGNGSQLTGVDATQIINGTSNAKVLSSGGNIAVGIGGTANVAVFATTGAYITGVSSASGNVTGGNILTGGLISAAGNITGSYIFGNGSQLTGIDATSIQNGTSNVRVVSSGGNVAVGVGGTSNVAVVSSTGVFVTGVASATGDVTGGNLLTGGLISATGNITGGNISTSGTAVVGGFTISGNTIVSSGSTLTIDPNTAGGVDGVVVIAGNLSVTGNVTYINSNVVTVNDKVLNLANNAATASAADGSGIGVGPLAAEYATITYNSTSNTWVISNGANVSGTVSVSGNVIGGNITTAGLISATGNITGGNILGGANVNATTHTGTTVSVTANVTGGNLLTGGLISATGNITGSNLIISGNIFDSTELGLYTTAANANIVLSPNGTGNVNLGRASASGNITAAAFYGSGAGLTSIPGGNVTGTVSSATSATTAGTVTTAAQPNITSVGTLSSVTVSGAISGGSLTVSTGTVTLGNIVNANGNGVGNIGSSSLYFNTVFGKATTAQYADLAENYVADADYEPGTVLVFGGNNEVTISTADADSRVAGVVSTNPAHLMNSTLDTEHTVAVALTGRVPTKVTGTVRKGDMMVTAANGFAQACSAPAMGTVIGKALENFEGVSGTIEIVVGRL